MDIYISGERAYSPPKIVKFSIAPHEHFVPVPLPIGIDSKLLEASFADFGGEYRTKTVPPEPNRFVADINPTFVQQALYIAKRE